MPKIAVLLVTAPPPGISAGNGAMVKVDGRECLLRSAELFVNRDDVVQVLTCFPPGDAEEAKRKFGGHLAFIGVKLAEPVDGWYGQIASMLAKLTEEATHLLIHDAARPAVAYTDLDTLAEAADASSDQVLALAAPSPAALIEVDGKGGAIGYRPADAFRLLLWPRLYPVEQAQTLADGAEPPAGRLKLLDASLLNVRCGGPQDAKLVQAMLKLLPQRKKEGPLNPFDEAQW